ncbi:Purine-binding protein precursor [Aquimixticola soesokkakensis]|uniref:Purine-binding protein n=1 Tax=Aquimixticola soesokkakensis TaxID=1519096 RepID=A0A1Y5RXL3_9RHOB|nr:BMP family protein [Aquimixticola soesokkakensis]SLN27874.1 Purine-binding protein precursor [Aquimixticola soesokkakensis]
MKIGVIFVGEVLDRGFNASALEGAQALRTHSGLDVEMIDGVPYDTGAMTQALTAAAARNDGVIFVGGQGNDVTPPVARATPDCLFGVVQGAVSGPNLASYDVLQEQSAFLAGCLAARVTKSGVVGHLSGHRVAPGLKGRAAFAAGVAHIDPAITLLTGFCGTQDDSAVTGAWVAAQARAGADVVFTMLNAARGGAIEACRAGGILQIGNVLNWCDIAPEVFVGSALARIERAVLRAGLDMLARRLPAEVQPMGLAQGDAVGLALSTQVPRALADELARLQRDIATNAIAVTSRYDGPEFTL